MKTKEEIREWLCINAGVTDSFAQNLIINSLIPEICDSRSKRFADWIGKNDFRKWYGGLEYKETPNWHSGLLFNMNRFWKEKKKRNLLARWYSFIWNKGKSIEYNFSTDQLYEQWKKEDNIKY